MILIQKKKQTPKEWMLDHNMQLPVVGANGIQNILDTILSLHPLLGFVNDRGQVLQMGFKRKKDTFFIAL